MHIKNPIKSSDMVLNDNISRWLIVPSSMEESNIALSNDPNTYKM